MKQSEAIEMLRAMLRLLQKTRSDMREAGVDDSTNAILFPWLFDEKKCPIMPLTGLIERAERSGILQAQDFFNMMTILYRFLPTVVALAPMEDGCECLPADAPDFMSYLKGWKPE